MVVCAHHASEVFPGPPGPTTVGVAQRLFVCGAAALWLCTATCHSRPPPCRARYARAPGALNLLYPCLLHHAVQRTLGIVKDTGDTPADATEPVAPRTEAMDKKNINIFNLAILIYIARQAGLVKFKRALKRLRRLCSS